MAFKPKRKELFEKENLGDLTSANFFVEIMKKVS